MTKTADDDNSVVIDDRTRVELVMLHEHFAHAIDFNKLQQWRVTNYAALLYAAIIAVDSYFVALNAADYVVLLITPTIVGFIASYLIWNLQGATRDQRSRLIKCQALFSDVTRQMLVIEEENKPYTPRRHMDVFLVLVGAVWMGAAAVLRILW